MSDENVLGYKLPHQENEETTKQLGEALRIPMQSGAEFRQWADEQLARADELIDKIINSDMGGQALLAHIDRVLDIIDGDIRQSAYVAAWLSTDASCREMANLYLQETARRITDLFQNVELYNKLHAARNSLSTGDDSAACGLILRMFEMNGIHLNQEKQAELQKLREREEYQAGILVKSKNTHNNDTVLIPESDLSYVPQAMLNELMKITSDDGTTHYEVPRNFTIEGLIPYVREDVAKSLILAREHPGGETMGEVLQQLVEHVSNRNRIAELLGYSDYRELCFKQGLQLMPQQVIKLLEKLLNTVAMHEEGANKTVKKHTGISQVTSWTEPTVNAAMLQESSSEATHGLDLNQERIVQATLNALASTFNLQITETSDYPLWADGVKAYEIRNQHGDLESVLVLDLNAREGKQGGAHTICPRRGYMNTEHHQVPISVICMSILPTESLSPTNLSVLMHEFGHAFANILASGSHSVLSGDKCVSPHEFEIPAHTFEALLKQPDFLRKVFPDINEEDMKRVTNSLFLSSSTNAPIFSWFLWRAFVAQQVYNPDNCNDDPDQFLENIRRAMNSVPRPQYLPSSADAPNPIEWSMVRHLSMLGPDYVIYIIGNAVAYGKLGDPSLDEEEIKKILQTMLLPRGGTTLLERFGITDINAFIDTIIGRIDTMYANAYNNYTHRE